MKLARKIVAVGALTVAAVTALAMPASASEEVATDAEFATQAESLGLSDQEASALQREVDQYLTAVDGVQVAVNKIEIPGSGVLLMALPGETYARDITTTSGPQAAAACPYEHPCAYKSTNYGGNMLAMYDCGLETMPWFTQGSYINNQTPGTVARFHLTDGRISSTGAAYYAKSSYNWTPVYEIDPC